MTVETIILFDLPSVEDPIPLKVECKVADDGTVFAWRGGWTHYYKSEEEFAMELIKCRDYVAERNAKYESKPVLKRFDISQWVEA